MLFFTKIDLSVPSFLMTNLNIILPLRAEEVLMCMVHASSSVMCRCTVSWISFFIVASSDKYSGGYLPQMSTYGSASQSGGATGGRASQRTSSRSGRTHYTDEEKSTTLRDWQASGASLEEYSRRTGIPNSPRGPTQGKILCCSFKDLRKELSLE